MLVYYIYNIIYTDDICTYYHVAYIYIYIYIHPYIEIYIYIYIDIAYLCLYIRNVYICNYMHMHMFHSLSLYGHSDFHQPAGGFSAETEVVFRWAGLGAGEE